MLSHKYRHSSTGLNRYVKCLFACLFLLSTATANAEVPTLILTSHLEEKSLGEYVEYFVDPTEHVEYSDILVGRYNSLFRQVGQSNIHFGIDENVYWLRLKVRKEAGLDNHHNTPWFFVVDNPNLDNVGFYLQTSGKAFQAHQGGRLALAEGTEALKNLVFEIPSFTEKEALIYLRVKHSGETAIPISISSSHTYIDQAKSSGIATGLFYGVLLALLAYGTYLFIHSKDSIYLYFLSYILVATLQQAAKSGFLNELSAALGVSQNLVSPLILCQVMIGALFVKEFLKRKVCDANMAWALNGSIMLCATFSLVTFVIDTAMGLKVGLVLSLFVSAAILSVNVSNYFSGKNISFYFIAAWAMLLSLNTLHLMQAFNLSTYSQAVVLTMQALVVINVWLIAVALAHHFSSKKREVVSEHMENISDLERSNKIKDEFLATISHELRTPMNGVIGGVELIKCTEVNSEQERYLNSVNESASDMIVLIDTILGYTELQSGELTLKPSPFNLCEKLNDICKAYSEICERKNLTFLSHDFSDLDDIVVGDAQRFLQVMMQLLDNAVKFTDEGSVTLIARKLSHGDSDESHRYLITVSDTGVGISSACQKELFESFRQLDGSFSREHGGVGIGLTLARKLIDLMGGELTFHSKEGEGSMFEMSLPLEDYSLGEKGSDEEELEKKVTSISSFKLRHEQDEIDLNTNIVGKVLVVEDNKVNQMVLKTMLKKLGHDVLTADNGKKAVELLENEEVDIILMDCQMPVMDGLEATRQIRKLNNPNQAKPILAVTANALSGDRERCLQAGMNAYVNKPLKLNVIKECLEEWLMIEKTKRTQESEK